MIQGSGLPVSILSTEGSPDGKRSSTTEGVGDVSVESRWGISALVSLTVEEATPLSEGNPSGSTVDTIASELAALRGERGREEDMMNRLIVTGKQIGRAHV